MAETAILIVFVLLLVLTTLLGREADRRRSAEQELEQLEEVRSLLAEAATGLQLEGAADLVRVIEADRQDANNWRELVRDLPAQEEPPSPAYMASQLRDASEVLTRDVAHSVLDEALDTAGVEPTPEALQDLAEITAASQDAGLTMEEVAQAIAVRRTLDGGLRDRGEEMTPDSVAAIVSDAALWREQENTPQTDLRAALDRANERIKRLESQAGGGGGTDHPSCWYDNDGTVAYLLDVALTGMGYVIRPARAPQHDRTPLPLASIRTGQLLSPAQFSEQTREIFEWSVANECRFFVRAFDLTAADQKEVYKDRMRTLESRFYKNANPSGPPPSVDPAPLRR